MAVARVARWSPSRPSAGRRGGRRSARARVGRAPRADGSDPPTFAADASRSGATRVVRLEGGPRGAVAYVVGASHVLGEDAARDVFALVGRHDPDVVLLELCAERAPAALRAAVAATRRAGPPTGPPEASPATAAPPRLAVTSVTVEGIPRDRPLPGASERDLLATLRARPNATLAPEDLDADAARLRSLGLFRDVAVEVRGADETDGERDRGGDSRDPLGSFVVSRVTGEVAELARASEVAFAVSPDPDDSSDGGCAILVGATRQARVGAEGRAGKGNRANGAPVAPRGGSRGGGSRGRHRERRRRGG